jgi:putative aldouronate transport system permease protein
MAHKNRKVYSSANRLKKIKKSRHLYLLLILPLAYYIVFHYIPMYGVLIAFKDYKISKGVMGSPWVGPKHFAKFLQDPYFWKLVRNTILLSFYGLLWGFPAPIILALSLNETVNQRFKKTIQNISYLPHFISTVVVCGMVTNFLASNGLINNIARSLGLEAKNYLMYPEYFRTIYIATSIWQSMGWNSIIYLAALASIDETMYEAAIIDGANRWHKIFYITLPSLAPTISVLLIMNLGRIMNVGYEKIILLYNGSIYETADVINTYVYRRGILKNDFSYATAVGLFQAVISIILIVSTNRISKKISETSLW